MSKLSRLITNNNKLKTKITSSLKQGGSISVKDDYLLVPSGNISINSETLNTPIQPEKQQKVSIVDDSIVKGGYHVLNTIEERDAILCCYRKQGMKVVVVGPDYSFKEYVLNTSNCDENIWEEVIVNVDIDESEVSLVEDYSQLGQDIESQMQLNIVLKNLLLQIQDSIENIEVPTNTSNLINDGEDGINPFITLNDIPEISEQVNSDWNAVSGPARILNKPEIPTNTSDLTNDGEDGINPFITLNDIPEAIQAIPKDFYIATSIGEKLFYKTDTYRELNLATLLGVPVNNSNEIIRVGDTFYIALNYSDSTSLKQDIVRLSDCYIEDNILKVTSTHIHPTVLGSVHSLAYNPSDDFIYMAERTYSSAVAVKICKIDRYTLKTQKISNFPVGITFGHSTTDLKIFNNKIYFVGGYNQYTRLIELSTNLEDYSEIYVAPNTPSIRHIDNQAFVIYNGFAYIAAYDDYIAPDRLRHIKFVEVNLLTKTTRVSGKIPMNNTVGNLVGVHWFTVYNDKLIFTTYSHGGLAYYTSICRVDIKTFTKEEEKLFNFPITDDNSILDGYVYLNGETFSDSSWIGGYPGYPYDNAQLVKINPMDFTDFSVEIDLFNGGLGSFGSINYNPETYDIELKTFRSSFDYQGNLLNNKAEKDGSNITNTITWRAALDVYNKSEVNSKFIDNTSESLTSIQQPTLVGNILTLKYVGENGVIQSQNVDLSNLITSDITIVDANYDTSTNIITLLDSNGDDYKVDLSEFSILTTTDVNGVTTLNQEGVTKLTVSRVGQTGDYNHLLNKPNTMESVNFEIVDGELIVQDVAGVSVILVDNELIIN